MTERTAGKKTVLRVVAVLVTLVVLVLGYGVLVEPKLLLDERRIEATLPELPAELAGTEVAFLSDMQVGMWFSNTGMVEKAVAAAVEADPDVVLLGGDYVYSKSPDAGTQVETVIRLLEPITSSDVPVYAVMGNHDHEVGAVPELTAALEGAGVTVLTNASAVVPGTGEDVAVALHVVGVGPARPGLVDVPAALSGLPEDAPRVVVMHNPTAFEQMPPGTAPITLAGHTHCGQVAVPFMPEWSYLGLTEQEEVVADGWAPDDFGAKGNAMFVSCGLGFSVVPLRLNAPPQLVLLELR